MAETSQQGSTPPTLNLSTSIAKHASPSHPASLLVSHLVSAAINHLLFARGQVAFPVSTLVKRPAPARKDRKRDALLSSLPKVAECVSAALNAPREGGGEDDGLLPLLVVFGPSPLSPLEAFAITIRQPDYQAEDPGRSSDEPVPPTPSLRKILSTLEQRLVRFLIATEELQEALAHTLRPTKMHIFALKREGWRAEGWKIRRGFRVQMGRVWGEAKVEDERKGAGEGIGDKTKAGRNGSEDGTLQPSVPASTQHDAGPSGRPASTSTPAQVEEDVGVLSEALSPLKKRRRPPLIARTSSSYSANGPGPTSGMRHPSVQSPTPFSPVVKTPKVKTIKLTETPKASAGGQLLWSPQPAAALRRLALTEVGGTNSRALTMGSDEAATAPPTLGAAASASALSPPPSVPLTNGDLSSGSITDSRPPGSRLLPPGKDPNKSLLARSRIISRGGAKGNLANEAGGQSSPSATTRRSKPKGPKGAAFIIDCSGGTTISSSSDAASPSRPRLGFESLGERGEALPGWQWYQCEVTVPCYLGS